MRCPETQLRDTVRAVVQLTFVARMAWAPPLASGPNRTTTSPQARVVDEIGDGGVGGDRVLGLPRGDRLGFDGDQRADERPLIADDQGLLLLDLKDLRAMVQHVGENAKTFTTEYGNVSAASIGAIQRGLLTLEEQGGDIFFGEPMLDIHDLMKVDGNGRGFINVLAAEKLVQIGRTHV